MRVEIRIKSVFFPCDTVWVNIATVIQSSLILINPPRAELVHAPIEEEGEQPLPRDKYTYTSRVHYETPDQYRIVIVFGLERRSFYRSCVFKSGELFPHTVANYQINALLS